MGVDDGRKHSAAAERESGYALTEAWHILCAQRGKRCDWHCWRSSRSRSECQELTQAEIHWTRHQPQDTRTPDSTATQDTSAQRQHQHHQCVRKTERTSIWMRRERGHLQLAGCSPNRLISWSWVNFTKASYCSGKTSTNTHMTAQEIASRVHHGWKCESKQNHWITPNVCYDLLVEFILGATTMYF